MATPFILVKDSMYVNMDYVYDFLERLKEVAPSKDERDGIDIAAVALGLMALESLGVDSAKVVDNVLFTKEVNETLDTL